MHHNPRELSFPSRCGCAWQGGDVRHDSTLALGLNSTSRLSTKSHFSCQIGQSGTLPRALLSAIHSHPRSSTSPCEFRMRAPWAPGKRFSRTVGGSLTAGPQDLGRRSRTADLPGIIRDRYTPGRYWRYDDPGLIFGMGNIGEVVKEVGLLLSIICRLLCW